MSPIADMVQQMLTSGVPHEVIVRAVRIAETTKRVKIGHRLPDDWVPSERLWRFALEKCKFDLKRADNEFCKFANYYWSKPGKDALRIDWERTAENWLRNATSWSPPRHEQRRDLAQLAFDLAEQQFERERGFGGSYAAFGSASPHR